MKNCPCGADQPFESCCGPYLAGKENPPTAEALMRSRYTAYVQGEIPYLKETYAPQNRGDFDEASVKEWSQSSQWKGLEILTTEKGGEADREGTVEFVARYSMKDEDYEHREIAEFRKESGRWYFVDGKVPGLKPRVREEPKTGRNDPCPCGSGKKFKKCHGNT